MLPRLHGENLVSPWSATGLMMNLESALQLSFDSGQQTGLLVPVVQPLAHYIGCSAPWSTKRDRESYIMLGRKESGTGSETGM